MFDSLAEKKKRFDELHLLLSDPKVIANTRQYQLFAKELARLKPVMDEYERYLRLDGELKEAERVLSEDGHDNDFIELARDEKNIVAASIQEVKEKIEQLLYEKDADSDRNVILEVRAGTGGLEAGLFAADLFRMYTKFASKKGWKTEMIDSNPSEKGGFKEVIFSISGSEVYGTLKFESGTHRVQRVPETEASGRIHTSAATVAVMPEAEDLEIEVNTQDLKIDVYRAGGHGGQHVNVTDSAVRITHLPTGLVVTCQDERSQHKNKAKALRVLRARLFDKIKSDHEKKLSSDRKAQVGTGDRSEKIRTYNFPDRRITDHRIGFTVHNLEEVLEGELKEIIGALRDADRKLRIDKAK
ncbi:MAG: peptide chain release factor 1 [Candidatus Omnitrophota bacterium]